MQRHCGCYVPTPAACNVVTRSSAETLWVRRPPCSLQRGNKKQCRDTGCDVPPAACNVVTRSSAETLWVLHQNPCSLTTRSSAETLWVLRQNPCSLTTRSSAETLWVRRHPITWFGEQCLHILIEKQSHWTSSHCCIKTNE